VEVFSFNSAYVLCSSSWRFSNATPRWTRSFIRCACPNVRSGPYNGSQTYALIKMDDALNRNNYRKMVNENTRSVPPWYRRQILREQGGKCANQRCMKSYLLDWKECETDHIIPWHQGGRTLRWNLQVLCITCHKNRSSSDARLRMKKKEKLMCI
jgi:hypothetical protein